MSPEPGVEDVSGSFSGSFVADVDAPRAARQALDGLSDHTDEGLVERARIVVTELVSNCVRHARLGPEQRVELLLQTRPEWLRVEVRDDGDGFDPTAARPHPDQDGGGWGLLIVAQLTDRWGVDVSHSTRIWCEFEPPAPPEPR